MNSEQRTRDGGRGTLSTALLPYVAFRPLYRFEYGESSLDDPGRTLVPRGVVPRRALPRREMVDAMRYLDIVVIQL